ncbi:hypothetical protein QH494_10675 [Sphingomonas sp. AR_OL41]|uniref:hypothetical protein n=1 Tax=Sphingomonas sp. AR_OL41 TaxID=3042729 RepID=UPI002480D5FB|nr:hypothetical protein [Sphingomonas sp. AR_OL41]MDH7972647.1 hypothetical protein [Sphingomonas sp. AR_OL41]
MLDDIAEIVIDRIDRHCREKAVPIVAAAFNLQNFPGTVIELGFDPRPIRRIGRVGVIARFGKQEIKIPGEEYVPLVPGQSQEAVIGEDDGVP